MNVLVDASVWARALRKGERPGQRAARAELAELIREHRIVLLGCIRQELLGGVKGAGAVLRKLRAFPDFPVQTKDYERAAELFSQGLRASNTDHLLCAVAQNHGLAIFTTDRNLRSLARRARVRLHAPK